MKDIKKLGAIAAIIRDCVINGEPPIVRFSIEGSTLKKEGQVLASCIARAFAITCRPANRSAVSGILLDPKQKVETLPQEGFKDGRFLSKFEAQYNPLFSNEDLTKALEGGNYNAAPSTLTQGSALQVEYIREKNDSEAIKNKLKKAYRDWDHKSGKDLKQHLKHEVPEISENYLDHFIDLVGYYKLKKSIDDLRSAPQINQMDPKSKEVVYGDLANSFFNVGEYVPGMEKGESAPVFDAFMGRANPSQAEKAILEPLISSGALDKLLIMDYIMGTSRGPSDYMLSNKAPFMFLINNHDWGHGNLNNSPYYKLIGRTTYSSRSNFMVKEFKTPHFNASFECSPSTT